jgi:hypothetical protein
MTRYNDGDDIIEINVRDPSGARYDGRRSNKSDAKENGRWLMWLIRKHGVKFQIEKGLFDLDSEFFKY